jgi:hypothetical protein
MTTATATATTPTPANFTPAEIAVQCKLSGSQVGPLPASVTGAQLLWAMAGNESSFGVRCTPRHEPAFDVGGEYATHAPMPALLAKYGSAAACSYGPWQILLANAASYTPADFSVLTEAAAATIAYLNQQLRAFRPQSLAQIGSLWNSGGPNHSDNPKVAAYIAQLTKFYATVLQ